MSTGFNFAAVESGFLAWLKEQTQTEPDAFARAIGTRKEISAIAEEMQIVPAVYVLYDGLIVKSADEFSATYQHRWLVILAMANAASQREAEPLNRDAGPLLARLQLLHGVILPGTTTPLVPATPPKPWFGASRFAYYPLAFTHESFQCVQPIKYTPPVVL